MNDTPKLFRVMLEVADLETATQLYADLFGHGGQRHPGGRHYFDCGGVTVAVLDVSQGGMSPTPGPKSLSFAVDDVDAVLARADLLGVIAPYEVHGEPAGVVTIRPWGERSFYIVDPWGNDLCFSENGTLYT
jgi:catechol 2,3-dioxygenase-like lactoylglutathione lyase family enzyme